MSKTRKLILFILSVIAVVALAIGLASCTTTHTHVESITVSDSTLEMSAGETKEVTVSLVYSPESADAPEWTFKTSPSGVVSASKTDDTTISITANSVGSATVVISLADSADGDATATISVTVKDSTPSLAAATSAVNLDTESNTSRNVGITAKNTDYTVASGDDSIATAAKSADGSGITITAVSAGTVTITITATADSTVTVTITVTVTGGSAPVTPTYSISVDPETLDLTADGSAGTVAVAVAATNDTDETWGYTVTEGDAYISVSKTDSGLTVTPVSTGTATITVYANGDNTVSKTITVNVTAADVLVESITATPSSVELTLSNDNTVSTDVAISVSPEDATNKSWSAVSNDTSVATVENVNGTLVITAVGKGETTIDVVANDGSEAYTTVSVTVYAAPNPITDIQIKLDSATINVGNTITATISTTPETPDDGGWKWSVSEEGIISVSEGTDDNTLTIKGESAGTVTLTVTSTANESISDYVEITVSTVDVSEIVVEGEVTVGEFSSTTIDVSVSPETATDKTWTAAVTDGEDYIVITGQTCDETTGAGTITVYGKATGSGEITITSTDGKASATVKVTVSGILVSEIQIRDSADAEDTISEVTLKVGSDANESVTVYVSVLPADADSKNWTAAVTDGEAYAEITSWSVEDGTISIKAISAGTATITVYALDGSEVTAELTVNVDAADVTGILLNDTEGDITVSVQVEATDGTDETTVSVEIVPSYAGNTGWYISEEDENDIITATKNEDGTITIAANSGSSAGTAYVIVTSEGNPAVTATITVNVTAAAVTGILVNGTEGSTSVSVHEDDTAGGQTTTVSVQVVPTYAADTGWSIQTDSYDSDLITVSKTDDSTLTITANTGVVAGTSTTITIYSDENPEIKAIITVYVAAADITGINVNDTLGATDVTVQVGGDSAEVTVEVEPTYASNTAWSIDSYDSNYVSVSKADDNTLTISAVDNLAITKITTTTVIVSADGNPTIAATITVYITPADVTGITVNDEESTSVSVQVAGDDATVEVAVQPSYAGNTGWAVQDDYDTTLISVSTGTDSITISAVAELSITENQTTTVTVYALGNEEKTAAITVTIEPAAVTGITVNDEASISVSVQVAGDDATVEVAVLPSYAGNSAWAVQDGYNTGLITVTPGDGILTISAVDELAITTAQTTTVTVYAVGDETKTAEITVTVNPAAVTGITVNDEASISVSVQVAGDDATVSVAVLPEYAGNTGWAVQTGYDTGLITVSTDTNSITISAVADLYITENQTTTVTVYADGDPSKTAEIYVTVTPAAVTGISLNGVEQDITVEVQVDTEVTQTVNVAVVPSYAGDQGWSYTVTDDGNRITVTKNDAGTALVITSNAAVTSGQASIKVYSDEDDTIYQTITVTILSAEITGIETSVDSNDYKVDLTLVDNPSADVTVQVVPTYADNTDWTAAVTGTAGIVSIDYTEGENTLTITAEAAGTTEITITASGKDTVTTVLYVTVNPKLVSSLTTDVSADGLSLILGKADNEDASADVYVTLEPSTATNQTWTVEIINAVADDTNKTEVVSVNTATGTGSQSITVTAEAAGTATIKITANDGSGISTSFDVTVTQLATGFTFSQQYLSIDEETSAEVTVSVTPADANNTGWSAEVASGSESLLSITYNDTTIYIQATHSYGIGYITVTSADGNATATITVNIVEVFANDVAVTDPDTEETVTAITLYLNGDGEDGQIASKTVNVAVEPHNADVLTWHATSSVSGIVSLEPDDSNDGDTLTITATSVGTTTITVYADGATGVYTTFEVTVSKVAVTSIDLSNESVELTVDGETDSSAEVTITVNPSNATYNTWTATISSSTPTDGTSEVISISPSTDASGSSLTISAVSAGSAEITITADGVTKTISVTVNPAAVTGILVNGGATASVSVQVDGTEGADTASVIVAVQPTYAGNTEWSYEVSGDSASINVEKTDTGLTITAVTGSAAGSAIITVKSSEGSYTAEITVTITAASVTGITVDGQSSTEVTVQVDGASGADTATVPVAVTPAYAGNQGWSFEIKSGSDLITAEKTTEEDGLVITAISGASAGSAEITVTSDEGDHTATIYVTVTAAAVTGITVNGGSTADVEVTVDGTAETKTAVVEVAVTPSYAGTQTWTYTIDNGGSYISVTPDVAGGTLTITAADSVSAGSAQITVTSDEGSYEAVIYVTINAAAVTGITVNGGNTADVNVTVDGGDNATTTVSVAVTPSYAGNQGWSFEIKSGSDLITADKNTDEDGLVITAQTGASAGSAEITVTSDEGDYTAIINVTINAAAVTGITVDPTSVTVQVDSGTSESVSVAVTPAYAGNQDWDFSVSGDSTYVSVSKNEDGDGLVIYAVSGSPAGSANITVTSDEGSFTAEITVTITAASATGITVNGDSTAAVTVQVDGASQDVTVAVQPTYAGDTSWDYAVTTGESSNLSISKDGNTLTIAAADDLAITENQTVVITVTSTDGSYTATITVTVEPASATGITVNGDSTAAVTVQVDGASQDVTVAVQPTYAGDTSWDYAVTTGESSYLSISKDGNTLSIAAADDLAITENQTVVITVTSTDGSYTATITVTVEPADATGIEVSEPTVTVQVDGDSEDVTVTVKPEYAGDTSWSYAVTEGEESNVSITKNGNVLTIAAASELSITSDQTVVITVTSTDGSYTATITVTVEPADATGITVNGESTAAVTVQVDGASQDVTVAVQPTYAGDTSWTYDVTGDSSYISVSKNDNTLTISAVEGSPAGSATITVTSNDGSHTATITVSIVAAAVTGITVDGSASTSVSVTVDGTEGANTASVEVAIVPDNADNSDWDILDGYDTSLITAVKSGDTVVITAVSGASAGITTVTVYSDEDNSITANIEVTVNAAAVTGIEVSESTVSVQVGGDSEDVTVTVKPTYAGDTSWDYDVTAGESSYLSISKDGSTLSIAAAADDLAISENQTVIITVTSTEGSFTATITVTVTPADVTGISVNTNTVTVQVGGAGQDVTVTVQPTYAGNTGWSVSSYDSTYVTVDMDGSTLTITAVSDLAITESTTTTVTVQAAGDTSKTADITVTVTPADVTGISVSTNTVTVQVGGAGQEVTVTVEPTYAGNTSWTVSSYDDTYVTVSENGNTLTITAVSNLAITESTTTTVTVQASGDTTKTADITVTITPAAVTGISIDPADTTIDLTLVDNPSTEITVTVEPTYAGNTEWTVESDTPSVATVSQDGDTLTITAVAAGTATVTITASGNTEKTIELTVNVSAKLVTDISAATKQVELPEGVSHSDAITVTPNNATDLSWTATSNDPTVATVSLDDSTFDTSVNGSGDATLYIKGIAKGDTTITIASTDGGAEYTINVTVVAAETGFSITSYESTLYVDGDSETFIATMYFSDSTSKVSNVNEGFTWNSTDPTVATVDSNGVVTPVAKGTTTITASYEYEDETYTTAGIEVTVKQLASITLSAESANLTVNGDDKTATITVTIGPDDANDKTWTATSSSSAIATVSPDSGEGTGTITITAVASGTTSIIITTTDGGDEAVISVSITNPISDITLTSDETSILVGGQTTVSVAVTPSDADDTSWEATLSGDTSAISLSAYDGEGDGTITVTGAAAGTATITVTSTVDDTVYGTITINVSSFGIEVGSTTATIVAGNTQDITVTITANNSTNTGWTASSEDDGVATVSPTSGTESGSITISAVAAGETTITVTADGDPTKTVAITVTVTSFSISVDETELSLTAGDTGDVTVTVTASYSENTAWTAESSATGIATVTAGGNSGDTLTITAVAAGTATITVATAGDPSKTVTITVTVSPVLSISGDDIVYPTATSTSLTLSVNGLSDYTVAWSSETTDVATVSGTGTSATVSAVSSPIFGSTEITATVSSNGQTYTATKTVYVTASFFYLAGVNESSWSTYGSSDAAASAGMLLDSTDEEGVYSGKVYIDKDATEWGFVIYFGGIETEVSGAWPYYDYKISVGYYDASSSDTAYVSNLSSAFQVTTSGYYTITLNLNGGQATVSINVGVTSVSLSTTGSSTLDYDATSSVTYTVTTTPTDAKYTEDDFVAEITEPSDWAAYLTLDTDFSNKTVTVTCIAKPDTTFTAELIVTVAGVSADPVEISVTGSASLEVDHVAFEETSYSYDVTNGSTSAWTVSVAAHGYASNGSLASNSAVTYSTTDSNVSVSSTGVVTASQVGTFTIKATSTENDQLSATCTVLFYTDAFYLAGDMSSWDALSQTATTLNDTSFENYGLTAVAGSNNTQYSGTFSFTEWQGFQILFLGMPSWDDAITAEYVDESTAPDGYYKNWSLYGADDMKFQTSGKYTITVDISGSTPVVTIATAT